MKLQTKRAPLLLAIWSVFLAGCAATAPSGPEVSHEVYANRLLAEKMAVAADAQRDYAALVAEGQARVERKQEMLQQDLIDVDYIGMPQELLQTMAYRYGYRYVEVGQRVQLRAINIKTKGATPTDVLRTIGQQIDRQADVVLSLPTRTIRLTYKAPAPTGARKGR
ncbi:DotD/TraH family lipoprotein [Castellaniella sp.]|uniref:DotD/TraH family lipoprotein n=1 Tax=Castellaniella sp. TaxID=1955812 RepID=UPI002AFE2F79|nr:DotD/TraH family lipoprotein [Castellaniella sp.]